MTDIAARRAILRKKGKCFLCLKSGHIIKYCDSQHKCQKCGGHHHVSICEKNANKTPTLGSKLGQQQNPVGNQQENQPKSETKSEIAQGTQTEASIMYVESNTVVLLQTAQSLVGKVSSIMDQKHKTRIVFDSCSQRSYISNRMRNTLNVETVELENLLVKTFGDEASKVLACDKVQVAVTDTKGNDIMTEAYSVPTICSPISSQSIKVALEEYPHLCGLNLADSSTLSGDNDVEVDILIGADYYWKFVTGTIKCGNKPGPVAVLTRLGWVLSGPVIQERQRSPACTTNFNTTHVLRIDAEEPANDVLVPVGNVHYLPHREVVREDKNTTKIRVVYDESAKGPRTSLNDCLHTGPSLNTLIFDILIRFRVCKVAMIADIEKAFLNIAISPEHRDYLRFFWVDDIRSESPNIVTLRFARLVFGLT